MIEVKIGSKIPLILQVFDQNDGLKCSCVLLDKFGNEFKRVLLNNIGKGLYANHDVEMPDQDYLIAQYFTNDLEKYEIAQDIFKSLPKDVVQEKYIFGEVIEKKFNSEFIIGEVESVKKETENT